MGGRTNRNRIGRATSGLCLIAAEAPGLSELLPLDIDERIGHDDDMLGNRPRAAFRGRGRMNAD